MYRTHRCNEIREQHIGQTVMLAGWVDVIRDHGGVLFVDLRDETGVTQVVVHNENLLKGVSKETVLSVEGIVTKRDENTVNPKIETGLVELVVDKLEVLGVCSRDLPFEIGSTDTNENIRLKHRFLDLRNPALHNNILLRSKVIGHMRRLMEERGFLDIQTPILTASSPEGARDFLVPSRKHPGKFYALPQAPQQFKQLLMVSGFDKYYQIAPCFRDEDARADRSPGEFYQLDFEMAFSTQEEVLQVCEDVVSDIFRTFSDKKVTASPFRRIPYAESMAKYGSDKPDLRNPLVICDVTDLFKRVKFKPFMNKYVRAIVAPCKNERWFFDKSLAFATKQAKMAGLAHITLLDAANYGFKDDPISKVMTPDEMKEIVELTGVKEGETIFFICDTNAEVASKNAGVIRTWLGNELELIKNDSFEFCFVVDFPMYEHDETTDKIIFTHNPFSMPQGGLNALETMDPTEILAYQYDLVCNGIELASGAVRNHSPEIMRKAFEIAGYSEDEVERRFSALYNAFQFGAPPHAGMAPGVDRIVMLLADTETIRDVIAFPLDGTAQDQMLGAPGEVTELQLFEANVSIRGKGSVETLGSDGGDNGSFASAVSGAKAVISKKDRLESLEQVNELSFTADEKKAMTKIFENMLKDEAELEKIDTADIKPMVYVMPMTNILRSDKREQPFERKALLDGAPQSTEDSWQVPRLVK
ncbi:MAG: aspartate--tRNA ligase [Acutalibacteraceae bacterium]|nr:aspartate--tRNA ligase [Acutalibacteraceae bacterium]